MKLRKVIQYYLVLFFDGTFSIFCLYTSIVYMPIYRGRFIIVDTRLTLNTTYFVAYLGQDLDGETYINP